MKIEIIPCLKDNYSYIVIDEANNDACVIDPSESEPIIEYLEEKRIFLKFILNTHHHYDHVGGNKKLKKKYAAKVIGYKNDSKRIPGIDILVNNNEIWKYENFEARIIHIPGHTTGHVCFYFYKDKIVFTGDTLFSLGCGRIFEGTPEMMFDSLNKLKSLPEKTKVFCGHEYTLNNALFLETIIKNDDLSKKIEDLKKIRERQEPSIPTTIGEEKELNFFLRSDEEDFKNQLKMTNEKDVDVFTYLRELKDSF